MRIIFSAIAILFCLSGIGQADTSSRNKQSALARFPAGEKGWYNFLYKNFNSSSLTEHLPDTVEFHDTIYVQLAIDPTGWVEDAEFTAASSPLFEKELRRLINKSPAWIPAQSPTGTVKGFRSWRLIASVVADLSSLRIDPADFPRSSSDKKY